MRILLVLLSFVAFCATAAAAQNIRVQSGDHPGFTRLVFLIGANREWELNQQNGQSWALDLSPPVEGFDTSQTFDLIQRNRLTELLVEDGLTLNLACNCQVSAFRHQGQYLVIDIADPDRDVELVGEEELASQEGLEEQVPARAALPDLAALLLSPEQFPEVATPAPAAAEIDDARPPPTPLPNPDLAEAAEIMAEQLARAAAAGLLDASLGQPQTFADPVPSQSGETPIEETSTAVDHPTASPHPPHVAGNVAQTAPPFDEAQVVTITALDAAIPQTTVLITDRAQESCSGAAFNVREWSDSVSFEQGIGELRLALYDDRDELIDDGAEALARYYLYFGFGAEARYWLRQTSAPSEDLLAIADIVDGGSTDFFGSISASDDCSQGELLWRYIAGALEVALNETDARAIQRAYAELPRNLRDQLGPQIARALHADQQEATARNIRDILHRGGRIAEAELRLLDLDIGIPMPGTVAETRQAFSDLLMHNGSDRTSTMAQALAFDRAAGILPSPERLTAAEALLREAGDGSETNSLWQELLLGHASLGNLDAALRMLSETNRSGSAQADALTELISNRVAVGDTAGLLVLSYSFGSNWRPEGSAAGRAQVSAVAMLREAGLYNAAQILRDVRRPLILPATESESAEAVDPVLDAWVNEDWSHLATVGSGVHRELAMRMTARPDSSEAREAQPENLARLNSIVTDSRALRSTIETLLLQPTPQ